MRAARMLSRMVAALWLAAAPAWAGINAFDSQIRQWQDVGDTASIEALVKNLEKAHAETPTLENSNDLGIAYLLTGKLDAAITLFRATEQKFPGNARVAANLGTALELKGENEEALEWIREGVIRDAGEHQGSEWLHARILTAKIALANNPDWFDKNSVLGLDFGKGEVPVAPEILPFEKGKLKGGQELLDQINYQLAERTRFAKRPDAVVGDLLASAGDLAIAASLSPIDGGHEDASKYYEDALKSGAPHANLIRKRLARYKADIAALPPPKPRKEVDDVAEYPSATESLESSARLFQIFVVAAFALAIGGIVVHMIRRKRIRG